MGMIRSQAMRTSVFGSKLSIKDNKNLVKIETEMKAKIDKE